MEENTKKVKETKKLSVEELSETVEKNAKGLSVKHGREVFGLLLNEAGFESTEGDWVIGYCFAPSLFQKMTLIDSIDKDKLMKGFHLLNANIIKENSDARLMDKENPKNHNVIIGACLAIAGKAISFSINQTNDLKKSGE